MWLLSELLRRPIDRRDEIMQTKNMKNIFSSVPCGLAKGKPLPGRSVSQPHVKGLHVQDMHETAS